MNKIILGLVLGVVLGIGLSPAVAQTTSELMEQIATLEKKIADKDAIINEQLKVIIQLTERLSNADEIKAESEIKAEPQLETDGYQPEWAKDITLGQALGKCASLETANDDFWWCVDMLLDNLNLNKDSVSDKWNKDMNYYNKDLYQPEWAKQEGITLGQAFGKCASLEISNDEYWWCVDLYMNTDDDLLISYELNKNTHFQKDRMPEWAKDITVGQALEKCASLERGDDVGWCVEMGMDILDALNKDAIYEELTKIVDYSYNDGYQPEWAKDIIVGQAFGKCASLEISDGDYWREWSFEISDDDYWHDYWVSSEISDGGGYVWSFEISDDDYWWCVDMMLDTLDNLNKDAIYEELTKIVDYDRYVYKPEWVRGITLGQILEKCTFTEINDDDYGWCVVTTKEINMVWEKLDWEKLDWEKLDSLNRDPLNLAPLLPRWF